MRLFRDSITTISSALIVAISLPALNAQPQKVAPPDPSPKEPIREQLKKQGDEFPAEKSGTDRDGSPLKLIRRNPTDGGSGDSIARIVKVTEGKVLLQLKDREDPVLLTPTDDAVITLNRQPAKLEDLKPGDTVKVSEDVGRSAVIARLDVGRPTRVGPIEKSANKTKRKRETADDRESLPAGEQSALGVIMSDSPDQGVLLVKIHKDAPAWLSGLQAGDYLMKVDGRDIETPDDYLEVMREQSPRGSVKLLVWREGKLMSGTAELVSPEIVKDVIVDNGLTLLYQEDREARRQIDQSSVELESERRVIDGAAVPIDRRTSGFRDDAGQLTQERFRALQEENRRLKTQLEGRDSREQNVRQDRVPQRRKNNETPQQQPRRDQPAPQQQP